ncbi:MAG: phosphohistidine phosphatase SixA [Pseudomonadota bacterium]|nr:phosphohistidine phosphatase SixA [Pseudomonadota bacterium]
MQFALMRHAEAEPYAPTDALRELTPYGRDQVYQEAQHSPITFKRIIVSPYLRAQQTAKIMAEVMGITQLEYCPAITPEGAVSRALLSLTDRVTDKTLIVCHMPIVAAMSQILTDGYYQNPQPFSLAEIRCFEAITFAEGVAEPLYRE